MHKYMVPFRITALGAKSIQNLLTACSWNILAIDLISP
jgi:hypothetical protein